MGVAGTHPPSGSHLPGCPLSDPPPPSDPAPQKSKSKGAKKKSNKPSIKGIGKGMGKGQSAKMLSPFYPYWDFLDLHVQECEDFRGSDGWYVEFFKTFFEKYPDAMKILGIPEDVFKAVSGIVPFYVVVPIAHRLIQGMKQWFNNRRRARKRKLALAVASGAAPPPAPPPGGCLDVAEEVEAEFRKATTQIRHLSLPTTFYRQNPDTIKTMCDERWGTAKEEFERQGKNPNSYRLNFQNEVVRAAIKDMNDDERRALVRFIEEDYEQKREVLMDPHADPSTYTPAQLQQ
jgi:hypothetical protein